MSEIQREVTGEGALRGNGEGKADYKVSDYRFLSLQLLNF